MDLEFARRWQLGQPPFDGLTVSTEEYVPLSVLRQSLKASALRLHRFDPDAELRWARDHGSTDELVTESHPLAWAELMAIVATDEEILRASGGGEIAFYAVFPESRRWYLRFFTPPIDDLPGNEYLPRHGRFDLTGSVDLIREVARRIGESGLRVRVGPARPYFDLSR